MDLGGAQWRKSSYSGTQGNCVEVVRKRAIVGIRDTEDRTGGASWSPPLPGVPSSPPSGSYGQVITGVMVDSLGVGTTERFGAAPTTWLRPLCLAR
ncbi:DUF397 domain-containing protein [Amycolatopsis minnesotensis]|uniref:DUF397 domain-containing protein n=1 Tax=Amycolatopsis minnesotensis TaxID=337894 RepID=A0ABP5C374_9PSEU